MGMGGSAPGAGTPASPGMGAPNPQATPQASGLAGLLGMSQGTQQSLNQAGSALQSGAKAGMGIMNAMNPPAQQAQAKAPGASTVMGGASQLGGGFKSPGPVVPSQTPSGNLQQQLQARGLWGGGS